ncbi:sugar-binding transcriptional regulator [Yoonia sp. SS1-5]|uniref:Sugar-binding transcriptional regulator n=1 Tax=Yoonia rhodophyticola TaxID=3137370 RepID=A0AAN0MAY9_9RHOB
MPRPTDSHARPGNDRAGRRSRHDDVIVEAAWCYYHDGLNQNDIAKRLGVSRASVVNYLAEVRQRDYVRITLDTDIFHNHHLVHDLTARFGLQEALIVPADMMEEHRTVERVIRVASDWLPQLLEPGDHLGVAWGETIYRLSEIAPRLAMPDLTIVQLLGSKPAEIGFASENCAAALANRFRAQCVNMHVPLLLSSPTLAEQLKAEPMIAAQLDMVAACRKVIFACGTISAGSHLERTGLLTKEQLAQMQRKGAAGVICGRIIDKDGAPLCAPNEDQMIGVTLAQMRDKDMRILVAAGSDRLGSTLAALRGGYATHLVTSADMAAQLLESAP